MEPSLGNESLARVLASAKSDMALAEHYDKSEEDNSVQNKDISLVQNVIAVREFPASHVRQFFSRELPQTAADSVCLPLLQWEEKRVWPPPSFVNALALCLQFLPYASLELCQTRWPHEELYGQENKCSLLEHDMSGVILVARGTNALQCSFVLQETLYGSLEIDKLQPWDPGQPLYGMGRKLSALEHGLDVMSTTTSGVAGLQGNSWHEMFFCNFEVEMIQKCMVALVELQPWPSGKRFLLVRTLYLDNWKVEMVQLKLWPSWKLYLSVLTRMECLGDTTFCTAFVVSSTNQMVLSNDSYWFDPMQPILPNLISEYVYLQAIPGHCQMWLMRWRTIEDRIILLQLQGGLHKLIWFTEGKLSCKLEQFTIATIALLYTIDHAADRCHQLSIGNLILLCVAPENSQMVTSFHSRGSPATNEPDCLASMQFVVSSASTYPDFSFTSLGMVALLSPGLEEGQGSNMFLTVCVAWPGDLECSPNGNTSGQPLLPTTRGYEGYIEKRSAVLPQISARTVQPFLLVIWFQSCHTGFQFSTMNHVVLVGGTESKYYVHMPWQGYFGGTVSLFCKLPCTYKLSSVWLLSYPRDITQCCSQILQWKIARPLYPTPALPWFSNSTPRKVALYNSEHLQGPIQQPKIGNTQLLTVNLNCSVTASYVCISGLFTWGHSCGIFHCRTIFTEYSKVVPIAWDFKCCLLSSAEYDAMKDHGKASSSIPWDPGGAAGWRLEGKNLVNSVPGTLQKRRQRTTTSTSSLTKYVPSATTIPSKSTSTTVTVATSAKSSNITYRGILVG